MRKLSCIVCTLLTAVMLLSMLPVTAFATAEDVPYNAFADYGQQTFEIPASAEIRIDGVVSEGEYACAPIEVSKDSEGMTWLDWTKEGFPEEEIPEILPYSIKYYVTYDKDALYVAAEIVEASLYTRCDRIDDIWGLDSLEIDVSVDAYDEIPDGTYSQADMLDRVRATYALWDDGSGELNPVGLCYTAASYCAYLTMADMWDYAVTRDEDKQLTTYEAAFYWEDLYMDNAVPNNVFINFQLHLGDGRYLDYVQKDYVSCLGGLRYAGRLTSEEAAELGTDKSMAPHIFVLTDADKLNSGVTEETTAEETTVEETTAEEITEAPTEEATAAPTEAPETEAPTDAPATEAPTEAPKSGCGSAIGMTAAVTAFAAAAAVVLKKKD